MQAFSAESVFTLDVLDQVVKDGQTDRAIALAQHLQLRWQDLRGRNAGWSDAISLSDLTLADLALILADISTGNVEGARARIRALRLALSIVSDSPEDDVQNATQATTLIWPAWDPNEKSGAEGPVSRGQTLAYRVEYENVGKGKAFGVYVTDQLPAALDESTLVVGPMRSKKDGTEVAPAGTYDPATRTITWLVGEVGSGAGGVADVSVQVRSDALDGTEIVNYATVYFPSVPQATPTNAVVSIVTPPGQPPVTAVGPARLWLGLESARDQAARFDVRAELYANGVLIAQGEALCVAGLTVKPTRMQVPMQLVGAESPAADSLLSLKVFARIGTTPDGDRCAASESPDHALGLKLFYGALAYPSRVGSSLGGEAFADSYLRLYAGMLALDASLPSRGGPRWEDTAALTFAGGNAWQSFGTWSEGHDVAIVRVTAPRTVRLAATGVPVSGKIRVVIQNQSRHPEVVRNVEALRGLVSLALQPLGACAAPDVVLHAPARFPIVVNPRAQLTVTFDATFSCASRYLVRADVHHTAIDGAADRDSLDDTCPRVVSPPFRLDPNPDGRIRDVGCGAPRADRTYGDDIMVDAVVK